MSKGEIKLKENEVLLPDGRVFEIRSVKLGYVKNKYFLGYQTIETIGPVEIFNYGDGFDIVRNFLISIFDDEKYVDEMIDDIDVETLRNIVTISKKVNKVEDSSKKNTTVNLEEV